MAVASGGGRIRRGGRPRVARGMEPRRVVRRVTVNESIPI
jgi:hypothetical protein